MAVSTLLLNLPKQAGHIKTGLSHFPNTVHEDRGSWEMLAVLQPMPGIILNNGTVYIVEFQCLCLGTGTYRIISCSQGD